MCPKRGVVFIPVAWIRRCILTGMLRAHSGVVGLHPPEDRDTDAVYMCVHM